MKRLGISRYAAFGLLFLYGCLISCSAHSLLKSPAACFPHFPDQDGWYGGDGAYSIELDQQRTLWLFGDTFVSEAAGRKDRIGMDVVTGNTVALSTCLPDQGFSIRYYLKKENSKFASFFGSKEWLWPQDPFIAHQVLYIPLVLISPMPEAPSPFNFKIAGHRLARIRDFSKPDPRLWAVDYLDWTHALPPAIEALAPASVVYENYVYFYSLYRYRQDSVRVSGNILVRIPPDKLENPAGAFEYLLKDGTWAKDLSPEKVKIIFSGGFSELSVRYHPDRREWLAVYLSTANKGDKLFYQSAPEPAGPWGPALPLLNLIAEVNPASSLYDQKTFCYAGKEHMQFSHNKMLVITYVCNSSEDANLPAGFLRKNLFLYRPVVKRVALP